MLSHGLRGDEGVIWMAIACMAEGWPAALCLIFLNRVSIVLSYLE
jgi:hypothetical protein